MPLKEGKSKKAFEKNIKTEIAHGKPPKQAVAIAYAVKRKNKAKGGEVKHVEQRETMHCEKCGHTMMAAGGGVEGKEERDVRDMGHPRSNVAKLAGGEEVMCAHGGRASCNHGCYAEGGMVQNEKLHPSHQAPMDSRLKHQTEVMRKSEHDQSELAKLARGGSVVDEIMKGRKKMAKGGGVEMERDHEDHFADDIDLSNVHYVEDEEHEVNPNPSDDDYSLVGQIMKERKKYRP